VTDQVENPARGHIPDDQQLLLQRMEDEQVRRALEQGCDRSEVTDVLGVTRRTTFNKAKRAYAYDFPLDVFGRGGRPSEDSGPAQSATADQKLTDEGDEQQLFDAVVKDDDESLGRTETWGTSESESTVQSTDVTEHRADGIASDCGGNSELREQLRQAIDALQAVDEVL